MHKVYRINGVVDFYVDRNQLKSLISDKTETLNKPVARCLLLLIEKRYEIIEQATFFSEVWNKFGVFVTPNTFYQNISLLRKSLSSVGLGDDAVKTVSRKGLMLSLNVEVEFIDYEKNFFISPATESAGESESDVNVDVAFTPQSARRLAPESVIEASLAEVEEKPCQPLGRRRFHTWHLGPVALLVCLIILSYSLHNSNHRVRGYFDNYAYLYEYNGCFLYSNALAPKEKVLSIVNDDEIFCAVNKYVYITTYDFSVVNSVVQCRFKIDDENQDNHCISHLFIGDGKAK
ncbi:winged helix-turn-helix domain-containing protein [Brenneria sp. 4F2]|nr:winged helix-turn-helix domain-containing protein [Brenneria bubanii]